MNQEAQLRVSALMYGRASRSVAGPSRAHAGGGNTLHAAILGASDGLSSNLSLMMGVAGVSVDSHALLVTGVAGLLGGGLSMAVGEWVSVTSVHECADREARVRATGDHVVRTSIAELAIDRQPRSLARSPGVAALTALLCFAVGATVPLLPYLVASGPLALVGSLVVGAAALFGVGAAITVFTGKSVVVSGGRQLVLGLLAAGITFSIGRAIGAAVV